MCRREYPNGVTWQTQPNNPYKKGFRFTLEIEWDESKQKFIIIMMNPSRADHQYSDETVNRVIGFAKENTTLVGYGGVIAMNICPVYATNPDKLLEIKEYHFDENRKYIGSCLANNPNSIIILGYGDYPIKKSDIFQKEVDWLDKQIKGRKVFHVGSLTKLKNPRHPLGWSYKNSLNLLRFNNINS